MSSQFAFPYGRAALRCCAMVALVAALAVSASAAKISGFAYVDRDNNGQLAFSDSAHPEWTIPNVQIQLYSSTGSGDSLLATTSTSATGYYEFANLAAGTFKLVQLQPVEFVDGLDTVGTLFSPNGVIPNSASPGVVSANNTISQITLTSNLQGMLYNFGELGMAPAYVSKRYLLGSAPPMPIVEFSLPVPEPTTAASAAVATLAAVGLRVVGRRRR